MTIIHFLPIHESLAKDGGHGWTLVLVWYPRVDTGVVNTTLKGLPGMRTVKKTHMDRVSLSS